MSLRNVTLELSLKPFGYDPSDDGIRAVAQHLFSQWLPLCREADMVSVLMWLADGSEILDYDGQDATEIEWARYLGGANPRWKPNPRDPEGIGLHSRWYLYMDEPPVFTYGWLRRMVAILKEVGQAITGLPVRVGETFDPGPEFAVSPFKYERHNEVCVSGTLGQGAFVSCYGVLNGDDRPYAGWPTGIPDQTPFGTFFGRQCEHFLKDMGFDYLWLSNGFGFGTEPWGLRGVTFDGQGFQPEKAAVLGRNCLDFWKLFRQECPEIPLEVRGTNLSTGMDLSSDAVPLAEIYRGGFNTEPPPNSPWAALNGDFGVELIGWMSHIAELPGETFPFRYYPHDPWWMNSPWLDRYGREAHDIYLPMAVSRIDSEGRAKTPTAILLLTCDDSFGKLPDQVPIEIQPHLLTGLRDAPDAPGPLVWIYPFDEYHAWTFEKPNRIDEVFFGDWLMRAAVNAGLPLNTVCSTNNLAALLQTPAGQRGEPVLVSPAPTAGTEWERLLLEYVDAGGDVMLYGPLEHAGEGLRNRLGLKLARPLEGEFEVDLIYGADWLGDPDEDNYGETVIHDPLVNAGGLAEVSVNWDGLNFADESTFPWDGDKPPLGLFRQGSKARCVWAIDYADDERGTGSLIWIRGTVTGKVPAGGHLLVPRDARECFPAERLLRWALDVPGYETTVVKREPTQPDPMLCIARHANGWFFSGYQPDTTVSQCYAFRAGAPLLLGCETWLEAGRSTYNMPRAWHRECRVFVEQEEDTLLSCREVHSGMIGITRRMLVTGLDDATVRFFHEPGTAEKVQMLVDGIHPYLTGDFREFAVRSDNRGEYLEVEGVTGSLIVSW